MVEIIRCKVEGSARGEANAAALLLGNTPRRPKPPTLRLGERPVTLGEVQAVPMSGKASGRPSARTVMTSRASHRRGGLDVT